MRVEQVHREPPRPHQRANCLAPEDVGVPRSVGTKPLFEARGTGCGALVRTPLLSVALLGLGALAPRCFSEGDDGVLAWSSRIDEALDIGSFQYSCGNVKGLASLQGLDLLSLFGSPTWARTRNLRINRLPLDLPANPHECSVSGVRTSNICCPFSLRKAREGPI